MQQAPSFKSKTPRERLDMRLEGLRTRRSRWEDHWRELSKNILPRRGRFLGRNGVDSSPGGEINGAIINSTATMAARILVSGLQSGLVNPTSRWFKLEPEDDKLGEIASVKDWLEAVENVIYDALAASNFYQVMPSAFEDLAVFGTAAVEHLEDRETLFRFQALSVGEYFVANDTRGRATTFYREFEQTVETVWSKYRDSCSISTKQAFENGRWDEMVKIRHAIEPASERFDDLKGANGKPWLSIHWEASKDSGDRDKLLSVKGFDDHPVHVARWNSVRPEAYGRSAGMDALPDCRMLQKLEKIKLIALELENDPPTQGGPLLGGAQVRKTPGAHNPLMQGDQQGIRSLLEYRHNLPAMSQEIANVERRINQAFYADLFLLASLDNRDDVTAREVEERSSEKLLMLQPALTRVNEELLDPVIDRCFNIVIRASAPLWPADRGIVPPPPPELANVQLNVTYVSPLQQAQRAARAGVVNRLLQYVTAIAQLQPTAIDKLDGDQTIDVLADDLGAPNVVRSDDQVAELREARAEQQRAEQQAAMAAQMAKAAGDAAPAMEMMRGQQ